MNNLNSLSYYAQVVIGEELWISNSRFNGLYKVNLESGKSVYIGKFPQYRLDNSELHFFAKKYGEKIYFFPKCASGIDIYDLETGKFLRKVRKVGKYCFGRGFITTTLSTYNSDAYAIFTVTPSPWRP